MIMVNPKGNLENVIVGNRIEAAWKQQLTTLIYSKLTVSLIDLVPVVNQTKRGNKPFAAFIP